LIPLFTPAQVRERDRQAIEEHGVAGYALMTRAATSAWQLTRQRWPGARRLLVLCGAGNNAGDGYVYARLAEQAGCTVRVVALFDPAALGGDAARAFADYQAGAGHQPAVVREWDLRLLEQCDLVVDAVFGTGLCRPVTGLPERVIADLNASSVPVLALDVPSGLSAGTGEVLGVAVVADATISFVGRKIGFYLGRGPDCTGEVYADDLGTTELLGSQASRGVADLLSPAALHALLPPRRRTAHKGDHGHVLIVGGNVGMSGAARLAGEAALHAGAGLVTIATAPAHAAVMNIGRPELMCRGVGDAGELAPLVARADVVVVGPGLGTDAWARELLMVVRGSAVAQVLDADALNLLAQGPDGYGQVETPPPVASTHTPPAIRATGEPTPTALAAIITPHPGEAARLLGTTTAAVQADRLTSARQLAAGYGAIAVLKGAGSLVASPAGSLALCDRGNPGMAVAGMGDVLSGVLAALMAQLGDAEAAARCGVLVHALAGDDAVAALGAERGLLAGDLMPFIRRRVNPSFEPPGAAT
jgi:hydroxyethylthiazole kinase-like uncharacterized protein yjeF